MTTRRRLYKPERAPARKKGVLYKLAPLGLLDANQGEVAKALYALGRQSGVIVGRAAGYDGLRDEYTVVGKSKETGKAQDFVIKGEVVAAVISLARQLNGGKMERRRDS